MTSETDEDSEFAPGVRRLLTEVEKALDNENKQRAREKLGQAHETLIQSRADELDMSEPLREALVAAVESEDFPDNIPLDEGEIPHEWTKEVGGLQQVPVNIDREIRELVDTDFLFRITVEPADRSGENYQMRFDRLDIPPERTEGGI
jgi:hypothetical protein